MGETGVALRCANVNGTIDPLTYPADIGRFGEAVLLYDRIVLVSQDLRELPGLINYFGEATIRNLFETDVLRVYFQQELPAFIDLAESIQPGWIMAGTPDHPRADDPLLRNEDDFRYLLRRRLASYPYLDEYSGVSDDMVAVVGAKTHMAPRSISQEISGSFVRWISSPSVRATVAAAIRARRQDLCLLDVVIDDSGKVRDPATRRDDEQEYINERLDSDLHLALDLYFETAMSPLAGASATLSDLQFDSVVEVGRKGSSESSAFNQILEIEDLPRLTDSFYRERISGESLLEMRSHPDTIRFRRWLSDSTGADMGTVVPAYLKACRTKIREDSITKSGFRAVGTVAVGVLNPIAGAIATAADWVASHFYYRPGWNPRVFIDGVLSRTLTQQGAVRRGLVVPPDARRLLRARWHVTGFDHTVANGLRLRLKRDAGETFNISYGTSIDDYRVLNEISAALLSSAGTAPVTIECLSCHKANRFIAAESTRNPVCGACRVRLLPFVPT